MILWLLLTTILIAVSGLIAWAVLRRGHFHGGTSEKVYVDQLQEIDREEATGLIDEADARMARLEVQRRLLASGDENSPTEVEQMNTTDRVTLVAAIASVAIGSAVIYAVTGSPSVPAHPMSGSARQIMTADLGDLNGSASPAPATTQSGQSLASVETMIERLEVRLADNPDDVDGWRMLGWSKFQTGDTAGAAEAYAKAVELGPDDSRILSVYGESLILSSGGFVSDTAADALQRAIAIDPDDARARFLLGLRKQQDGDIDGTLDDWLGLLADAPAGAEWFDDVYSRTEELAVATGRDISSRLPPRRSTGAASPASQTTSTQTMPTPTQEQVDAANQMSAEDRQAMIVGMVERLETRLQAEPDDLDGWERLIRSRLVLRQSAEAQRAFETASRQFSGNEDALARLTVALNTPQP